MSSSRATSSQCSSASRIHGPGASPPASFGISHPGLLRSSNEDAYAVAPGVGLFAVADGVGGNPAGEVASRMAIDVVLGMIDDVASARPAGLGRSSLVRAVQEANGALRSAARLDPAKEGMATTFTGLLVLDERAVVAHVGDSRAYLLRGRRLHRLTEDHTLVDACVRIGLMTHEEAATSPARNQIVRAVGLDEDVDVDTRLVGVEPGDTFLLASDGLHGVVADKEIAAVLLGEQDPARAAARLVQRANDAGGPDNITVVIARVG